MAKKGREGRFMPVSPGSVGLVTLNPDHKPGSIIRFIPQLVITRWAHSQLEVGIG